ncbi:MAG: aromatic/alkene monooxygenase hydroxylase subunit beta [Gammaproteobacteria bacterium]|nr:aromatic/alkene monooxygenase hydroxylase subunit beta [Gammaproteobacteria bacterium]
MSIQIASRQIKPARVNYAHIERRIGPDKPATRYQEAVYDVQPTENFHYAPTWEPDKELFDASRTAIVMQDWYSFMDPRQYYYTSYVSARARQQESMEKNFELIEDNDLLGAVPEALRDKARQVLIPLRHVEYGANISNQDICDRGYGATITSLASFNGLDRIGMAQYLSRIALMLDGNEETSLVAAREAWLNDPTWQPLRHAMEDIFVLEDWFEIMVAQNIVMDGLLYPLIYREFIPALNRQGGTPFLLMTQLMSDWYSETERWTNQLVKVTAAESTANQELLQAWVVKWMQRLQEALLPVAKLALDDEGEARLADVAKTLQARLNKNGLSVE